MSGCECDCHDNPTRGCWCDCPLLNVLVVALRRGANKPRREDESRHEAQAREVLATFTVRVKA